LGYRLIQSPRKMGSSNESSKLFSLKDPVVRIWLSRLVA